MYNVFNLEDNSIWMYFRISWGNINMIMGVQYAWKQVLKAFKSASDNLATKLNGKVNHASNLSCI